MYKILKKAELNENNIEMEIAAPFVTRNAMAGQFIMFRLGDKGERIPLTIYDWSKERGSISIIFQPVGKSTKELARLKEGDSIKDFVGPLGKPTTIKKYGTVVMIGGGLGIAPLYPQARAFKEAGNRVISIIGARTDALLILKEKMAAVSDEIYYATNDGSIGIKGIVTDVLKDLIAKGVKIEHVVGIGPLVMMHAIQKVTKENSIDYTASLNTIMVDGTGMCGACRASVGGKTVFPCVEGPDVSGNLVDFDELLLRNKRFEKEEKDALGRYENKDGRVAAHNDNCVHSYVKELSERVNGAHKEHDEPGAKSSKKVPMREQAADVRNKNFNEVALGYSEEEAITEAKRCLNCRKPACVAGCPVGINIPEFIKLIEKKEFKAAAESIKSYNSLPAVCGRVCPQETQCEEKCIVGKKNEPVAIGRLERFIADWERENIKEIKIPEIKHNGKKIAVIGSGPAGLTCAGELAKMGYDVTIFEAFHVAGGVLVYGIPEFRLPKAIVQKEIDYIKALGVKIEFNVLAGRTLKFEDFMKDGFAAIFVATGAGAPQFMNIPGENANGVYSSNEFLTRVNLMRSYMFPNFDTPIFAGKKIAVVGGGNTAMDSARTAKRLPGTEKVYIIYRRSFEEMPARLEERYHAQEEGVEFVMLTNPVEVIKNERGYVSGVKCIKMELGEPDASGRRKPVPMAGSEYVIECDTFIVAIGTSANPIIREASPPDIHVNKWGNIIADPETCQTSIPYVFAGGDIVIGSATVIEAMGAGKRAARGIDEYVKAGKA
ncbi:MAG TPA: NADPH-dependent glutamate synthase [Candidatus Wallbacteria bacterium]|nr:NADPH-dependent glutamate synthase [Candidatus Wallbacteria bacterium]